MNTGLNPSFDRAIALTIASAMSELACVHVSMTLLYRSPFVMLPVW
jgi:hypothetical protein